VIVFNDPLACTASGLLAAIAATLSHSATAVWGLADIGHRNAFEPWFIF
jgi:hypothetical protein